MLSVRAPRAASTCASLTTTVREASHETHKRIRTRRD
jgi:hypothetical protein